MAACQAGIYTHSLVYPSYLTSFATFENASSLREGEPSVPPLFYPPPQDKAPFGGPGWSPRGAESLCIDNWL